MAYYCLSDKLDDNGQNGPSELKVEKVAALPSTAQTKVEPLLFTLTVAKGA
jgi:hypothetical protein